MTNQAIIQQFEKLVASLQIIDAKKYFFQIRSYQKVIEVIRNLPKELSEIYTEKKDLEGIEGIGPAIESKIIELLESGHSLEIDQYASQMPQSMFELLGITGVGAKRAYKFAITFNLTPGKAVAELEKAAKSGKIRTLEGFGEKSEQDVIESIELSKHQAESFTHEEAMKIAEDLIKSLKKSKEVIEAIPLGSLRRKKAKVRDIDLGISTKDFEKVKEYIRTMPQVKQILADGEFLIRVILQNSIQVDIKCSAPEKWGAFLQHFTGSKDHNIKLRELALKQGKSLSEHGIKLVNENKRLVEFDNEKKFYANLGLKWIPPEKRLGEDEIKEAMIEES